MKLWQKIFIITLILTLAGTQLTAYLIAYRNFRHSVDAERERLITEHRLFISEVENRLVYRKFETGKLSLSEEETEAVLKEIIAGEKNEALLLKNDKVIAGRLGGNTDKAREKSGMQIEESSTGIIMTELDGITCALCGSEIKTDSDRYSVYTSYDVTKTYDDYHAEVRNIRHISYIVSFAIAAVLLVFVLLTLRPLTTIEKEIKGIAGGEYDRRITPEGSAELVQIAKSVNEMAEAIEENVGGLQKVADARKQFIDSFAHEMKTPLTSIMGFADILRIQRNLKDKQRVEYASIILEEAKRLRSLSGKLLQLATADKVLLELAPTDMRELFRDINIAILPMIVNQGMKLEVTCEEGIVLNIDRELIKSLVYNLIDNAVKASEAGGEIRVDCSRNGEHTVISVMDFGMGMKPEDVKRVTEPFYMVDKSRARKAGGAGLGLSLCSEIAKQHGAKLKITSEAGKGTVVMVIFG